jgi:hypothetical protein
MPPARSNTLWVSPGAGLFVGGAVLGLVGALAAHGILRTVLIVAGGILVAAFFVGYAWRALRQGIPEHDRRPPEPPGGWSSAGP